MEYTIENQYIKATITTWGAQVKSVLRKCDNVEHMWQADPQVWGYHAPILFPYTGRLPDGEMECKGLRFSGLGQHGFARLMEHTLVRRNENSIELELTDTEETYAQWPYHFRLVSTFVLENDTLHHKLTVENRDEEQMPFGIGFHPAFAVPFDASHKATDYSLVFSQMESPLCLGTMPKGLINGDCYYLGKNIRSIPVDEKLFANDSHCITNLASETMGLMENGTGRGVICKIQSFPYTLIWSKPGMPRFVCIEPWNSLPSPDDGSHKWEEKPAAAMIAPGDVWSTTLSTAFVR